MQWGGHVRKTNIAGITVGAVGALVLCGAGIASASTSPPPDVVGMTYSDAVSKIEDGGGTAKISVTVGDRQAAMGDCLVTSATNAPFVEDSDGAFQHVDSVVLLALNCDRGVATATTPGASLGSPEGRAFQDKAEKAAAAAKQDQDAAAAKQAQ
jgi:hypothetical protein